MIEWNLMLDGLIATKSDAFWFLLGDRVGYRGLGSWGDGQDQPDRDGLAVPTDSPGAHSWRPSTHPRTLWS